MAVDKNAITLQLAFAHEFAARMFEAPEIRLSAEECGALADSLIVVAEAYDISIPPKMAALIGFATTALALYAPRTIAIAKRKKAEAEEKRKQESGGFPATPNSPQSPIPPNGSHHAG